MIVKMEKRRFQHEFALLFLLALAVGAIVLQSNFSLTGNVVSNGATCDGNWTCGDWTTCADSNQSRQCTLDVTSNSTCTSPVTEYQTCVMPVTNSTNSTVTDTNSTTNSTVTNTTVQVTLSSLSIASPATKLSYVVGETLNILGLVVTGTYSDNSTKNESVSTSDITGFDSTSPTTNQVLTITLQTKTVTYSVSIAVPSTSTTNSTSTTDTNSTTTTTPTTPITNDLPQLTGEATQPVVCSPNWQCGDWQECVEGNQARACTDVNNCGTQDGMPATSQACVVPILETCSDKIKNQNETGVDCGGPCKKCSIFNMVGGVINGPLGSVGKFFSNKTNIFITSGAFVLVIGGFVCFKIFKKRRKK